MSEPLKKLPNRRVTKEGIQEIYYSNDELAGALGFAIDRINELEDRISTMEHDGMGIQLDELEAKYEGHIHHYYRKGRANPFEKEQTGFPKVWNTPRDQSND